MNSTVSTSLQSGVSVHIDNVAKSFGDRSILKGIDLEIQAGTFHVLIGPSGCGKTTLLRMIGGLEAPSSGDIRFVNGSHSEMAKSASGTSGGRASREASGLSYGFQEPRLLPWLTVSENIALPLTLRELPPALIAERVKVILTQVQLSDSARLYPHQLSGGMKMRVAIGRSLVSQPQVLLLDEPFGALDEITKNHLDDELYRLWSALGMTVVLVTHSLSEAVYLGQYIHVLSAHTGKVAGTLEVNLGDRTPETRLTTAFTEALADAHTLLRQAEGGER